MIIYFDLDGVLANFDKGTELLGVKSAGQGKNNPEEEDRMWEKVREADHFYQHLKPIPGMVEYFHQLNEKYDCRILSGIPRPNRGVVTARMDKIYWCRKLLGEKVPVIITYARDKYKWAGEGKILIDDFIKNIIDWEKAGGIAIHFTDIERLKRQMKRILKD